MTSKWQTDLQELLRRFDEDEERRKQKLSAEIDKQEAEIEALQEDLDALDDQGRRIATVGVLSLLLQILILLVIHLELPVSDVLLSVLIGVGSGLTAGWLFVCGWMSTQNSIKWYWPWPLKRRTPKGRERE